MQVVIYARHSLDKQGTSSQDQIDRCKIWCDQKEYIVAGIFRDESLSGSTIQNRSGILEMIDFLNHWKIDLIVCEDLSRLSRSQGDITTFYQKTQFLEIEIKTLTEGPITPLHIGLKGTMNEIYLTDLKDKTRRGMIASVKKGTIFGGKTYGYDVVRRLDADGESIRGLRKINQEEAKIVETIFRFYASGDSFTQICDHLNKKGVPSPKGGKWRINTLFGPNSRKLGILRQTLYKGVLTYNKIKYKKHPETGARILTTRPEHEWIEVPAPDLAIMTEELFEQVQKRIERRPAVVAEKKVRAQSVTQEERALKSKIILRKFRATTPKVRKHKRYVVSRNLVCAHCSNHIIAIRAGRYNCLNKRCHNKGLMREELIYLTMRRLRAFSKKELEPLIDQLIKTARPIHADQKRLTKILTEKKVEITRLLGHIAKDQAGKETLSFITNLEVDCHHLRFEMDKNDQNLRDLGLKDFDTNSLDQIFRNLKNHIDECIKTPDDPQKIEDLQKTIHKIIVTRDKYDRSNVDVSLQMNATGILHLYAHTSVA